MILLKKSIFSPLLQYIIAHFFILSIEIIYQLVGAKGPDHDKVFDTTVLINGVVAGEGSGKSKKEAEQNAAKQALLKLGENL